MLKSKESKTFVDLSEDSELGKEIRRKHNEMSISIDQLRRVFNGEELIHPVLGKFDIWYLRRKEEK